MEKVKISAVSYLNTLPFIYGMEQSGNFLSQVDLQKDIPSACAQKLLDNEVDLGLVPVAIIPKLKEAHIISDFCIGAIGKVKSVLLVSDVPLVEIENIYLDYHSRTSVRLCQLLAKKYWKIQPNYLKAAPAFETEIKGSTAGVIIGDRTFNLPKKFNYVYDLSEEWMKWQKLPFVFAAWVSNKKLDDSFIDLFNQVLADGVNHIDEAISKYKLDLISSEALTDYLKNDISYPLDEEKRKGLALFLEKIK
ncbi:MAG: menaquinone biosynthesis protein [Vicingaceae bacterium]